MPTYLALLRGINVGKAKRVPMAELKALLEGLGCTRVTTLLNSGNAVFQCAEAASAALAATLAQALRDRFGFEVPVVVKSAGEFGRIVREARIAGPGVDPSHLLAVFAQSPEALKALKALAPLVAPAEAFQLGTHGAYLHCVPSILESPAGKALLGKTGHAVTTRNWATVLKLQALVATYL